MRDVEEEVNKGTEYGVLSAAGSVCFGAVMFPGKRDGQEERGPVIGGRQAFGLQRALADPELHQDLRALAPLRLAFRASEG